MKTPPQDGDLHGRKEELLTLLNELRQRRRLVEELIDGEESPDGRSPADEDGKPPVG